MKTFFDKERGTWATYKEGSSVVRSIAHLCPSTFSSARFVFTMAPSAKSQLKAAKSAIDADDPNKALSILTPLLSDDPTNYNAHVLSGVAHVSNNNLTSALQSYTTAISLRPDFPLAHRGVIDAIRRLSPNDHSLQLARSQLILNAHDAPEAARVLYHHALQDGSLREEAIQALLKAAHFERQYLRVEDTPAWKAAHLVLQTLPAHTVNPSSFDSIHPSLPALLDSVCETLSVSTVLTSDIVVDNAVSRVTARVRAGVDVDRSISFLQQIGAYENLLELAEKNHVVLCYDQIVQYAARALHIHPQSVGRSAAVIAAQLGDVPSGLALAGISDVKAGKVIPSAMNALVCAWLRLRRKEPKLAVEVARRGKEMVEKGSLWAALALVLARGLAEERRFKEAIREYESVRMWAKETAKSWVEDAANRGLVETAVIAHGRRSRQASMAVEEAAGSAVNAYGVLECVWTDALAEDVDCDRMEDLTRAAVQKAREGSGRGELMWEFKILDSMFGISDAELAALAASRLGQMLVQEFGYEKDILERAQRWHMEAAGLFKGMPNPFAQLGWIFEQMAKHGDSRKMIARAIRCYEKAVSIDASHPLASRRLVRLLNNKGFAEDAVEVARLTAEKNPKERWAYNVVGWHNIERARFDEALIAFRNALRGKPKFSAQAEEALFGTSVGKTMEDNDLVVDVDSWRGLSLIYRQQGKVGPALSCIEDAFALVRKPPLVYTSNLNIDVSELQQPLEKLLAAEKGMLQQLNRQSEDAAASIESILCNSYAPLTMKAYLSEVYTYRASKEWLSGCYHRATVLRTEAVKVLRSLQHEQLEKQPQLNSSSTFKRIGDILMEAATSHPKLMSSILRTGQTSEMLVDALRAFCKALHMSPWECDSLGQDVAAALLRLAIMDGNEELASQAIELLLQSHCEPSVLIMSLLTLATIKSDADFALAATNIALHAAKSETSKRNHIALNASIAVQASLRTDTVHGADSAISAIRHDPTDWRGWFAVAVIREADAMQNNWPLGMIRSSESAYLEADRLGGGPCAVHGVVRCLVELLQSKRSDLERVEVYHEACFCASSAARVGLDEPDVCREIINEHISITHAEARLKVTELAESNDNVDVMRHVHLYPFISDVVTMELVAS